MNDSAHPAPRRNPELWVGLGLTVFVVCFHCVRFVKAGGLWRDEAAVVGLATMPAWSEVFRFFHHEAFPLIFPATIRTLAAVSGDSDTAYRVFGLIVGLGIVAALWWNFRILRGGVPLLSLALLGFNAAIIRWGDSLRGYGLGALFILLTAGLFWRALEKPNRGRIALATLGALASVHSLLHNPALLFALGMGAVAVALRRKSPRDAVPLLAVGFIAGLTMLPYWSLLRRGREWDVLVRTPVDAGHLWHKIMEALSASGVANTWIWVALILAAAGICVRLGLRGGNEERDFCLFCGTALVLAIIAQFCFLLVLSYPTHEWYYLALMSLVALLLDLVFAAVRQPGWARRLRLALALVIAATSLPLTCAGIQVRQTNVDLVAARLQQSATPGDLIIVSPWYDGISFARYYHGPVAWTTMPPMEFHRFHRFDLLLPQIAMKDQDEPIRPVRERANETLKAGHRVWIVGTYSAIRSADADAVLARATPDKQSAVTNRRAYEWSLQLANDLRRSARNLERVSVTPPGPVSDLEDLPLTVCSGWAGP